MREIMQMLADIEAYRSSLPPDEREALEKAEIQAQRESWIRAMAPCEHGDSDWETCSKCLTKYAENGAQ